MKKSIFIGGMGFFIVIFDLCSVQGASEALVPANAPTAASSVGAAGGGFSSRAVSVEPGDALGLQDTITRAIQEAFMIRPGRVDSYGVLYKDKILGSLRTYLNQWIASQDSVDASFKADSSRVLDLFYAGIERTLLNIEEQSLQSAISQGGGAAVHSRTAAAMKERIIHWVGAPDNGFAEIQPGFLQDIQPHVDQLSRSLAHSLALAQGRKVHIDRANEQRLAGEADVARQVIRDRMLLDLSSDQDRLTAQQETRRLGHTLALENNRIRAAKWFMVASAITALAGMGGYLGLKHYFKKRPQIIRPQDTSISFGLKKAKYPSSRLDKLILPPALQKSVMQKFQGMEFAITQGLPLSNMLFYGPPGVGKSLAAQEFVRSLSDKNLAHHIIIRGPAFQQFKRSGEAVSAIRAIFEAAEISYKKTKKPTVIDFEEAEILFADRGNSAISTEMSRSILNTVLGLINESVAHHIALMFTTNRKDDLDPAILDRVHISNQILFDVPEQKEREVFLRQYLNDVLLERGFEVSPDVFGAVPELARSITGLSGRQISGMITQAIYPLLNSGQVELTLPLFKEIIADTMAKKAAL